MFVDDLKLPTKYLNCHADYLAIQENINEV